MAWLHGSMVPMDHLPAAGRAVPPVATTRLGAARGAARGAAGVWEELHPGRPGRDGVEAAKFGGFNMG